MSLRTEEDFLALIDRHFSNTHGRMVLGRGDDAAVLTPLPEWCVSTDLFLEDIHYRRRYFTPREIGRKALAVNVSDIHGMGARAVGFCLGLMVSGEVEEGFWEEALAGMAELAEELDLPLVGGDLSRAATTGFSVTIWGEAWAPGRFLRRAQVAPGDTLAMIGWPGLAYVGLKHLEAHGRDAVRMYPEPTRAHLWPRVYPEAARILARTEGVKGAMDVSDGLARDLQRFVGPGNAVSLDMVGNEFHPEVLKYSKMKDIPLEDVAIRGGEEYGLLFGGDPETVQDLTHKLPDCMVIGNVVPGSGLWFGDVQCVLEGFDHFGD
jgi:thiamine-monophosphate kinase